MEGDTKIIKIITLVTPASEMINEKSYQYQLINFNLIRAPLPPPRTPFHLITICDYIFRNQIIVLLISKLNPSQCLDPDEAPLLFMSLSHVLTQ